MLTIHRCHPILETYLHDLENDTVPENWLKIFSTQNNPSVSLEVWMNQLRDRRQMLGTWYTVKHCDTIKLHLLQNPSNIFHVLKEAVAEKMKTHLENIFIEARILDLPHNQIERSALFSKIATQNSSTNISNYTIIISNAILMNATWAKDKYCLEFMHPATASKKSQVGSDFIFTLEF
jgi:hypothetical protein